MRFKVASSRNCVHARIKVKLEVGQIQMKEKSVLEKRRETEEELGARGHGGGRQAKQRPTLAGLRKPW